MSRKYISPVNYLLAFFLILLFAQTALAQQQFYKVTTPLPVPRQMYGAVVLGDYLYVIGGNVQAKGEDPEGYVTTVEMAAINPDGTLGDWKQTTPLPKNRSYISNSTLVFNDIVYVVMGSEGMASTAAKTIYWTRPLPNGHLEPWRESIPQPGAGIKLVSAVMTPGYINILGGRKSDNTITNEVWSAKLGSDGDIVSWEQGEPLPQGVFFH